MSEFPEFTRRTIFHGTPAERVLLVVGDLDNDDAPEIVIGSRRGENGLYWLEQTDGGEWRSHLMDASYPSLEAGGYLVDLTGNGRLDFVGGGDARTQHVSWWECPDDPTQRWTRHLIHELPAPQCHDQIVADIDGDGRPELYFWCQKAEALCGVRVPEDPRVSPWPGVFTLATDVLEEGFAMADVDGDGAPELIAGLSWYRVFPDGTSQRHRFAAGFVSPRLGVGDFSRDGRVEIVLAEGDASYRRTDSEFGRVVHLRPGDDPEALWDVEILHDKLLDPHSVVVADFDGDGAPDVFVGELGSPSGDDLHTPQQRIFFNRNGQLIEQVIDSGLGTHEAKLIQLDGQNGIVGKPYRSLRAAHSRSPEIDGVQLWMPA